MPTITSCLCSRTLACSLHRGQGVHFLLTKNFNRTMWEFFFSAVISKYSSYDFLTKLNRIFVRYIPIISVIIFFQFSGLHIVFDFFVKFLLSMVFKSSYIFSVSTWLKLCKMSGLLYVVYLAIHICSLLSHSWQECHFCAKKCKFYINITSSLTILYITFLGLFFNINVRPCLHAI